MAANDQAKTAGNGFFLILSLLIVAPFTKQLIQGTADFSGFTKQGWLAALVSWSSFIIYIFMWAVLAVAVYRIIANIRLKSGTIKTNG